jgi:hypothetical protein
VGRSLTRPPRDIDRNQIWVGPHAVGNRCALPLLRAASVADQEASSAPVRT